MKRAQLSSHGPELSRLVYGTWRLLGDAEAASPAGLLKRLRACLDVGITTIDTAEIYGHYHVEEAIGAALSLDPGVKAKMEIVTKAGIYVPSEFHPERKIAHYNATADRLVKSAEKSLRLLGVDCIDLFLVHRPDWLTSAEETAQGLNRLLKSGKVRAVGVSNYTVGQVRALQEFLDHPLATNQLEFSPFCLTPIFDGAFDQCQELGMKPMAWSPTGGGKLFDPADQTALRLHKAMQEMAPRYGNATIDQLCYAWILAHPAQPVVVLGTTKMDRIKSAAGADSIQLSREDWYGLAEAARGRRIP